MTNPFEDENGEYLVLINDEGQYSLWPAFLDVPLGWRTTGPRGARQACLDYIDENWKDMRPLSLVRQMEEDRRARDAARKP
jgi:MbtH protein